MEEITQGSIEWLQQRVGHVTASGAKFVDSYIKDGKTESASRRNYRVQLVTERLTQTPAPDGYKNSAMQRGIDLEPIARMEYETKIGVMVDEVSFIKHPNIKWFGASPDGLVGNDGLVEIKCPESGTHIEYIISNRVPSEYKSQMIAQCLCTQRKWVDFVSYDNRLPDHLQLFVIRYTPTEKELQDMEASVLKFLAEVETLEIKLGAKL